MDHFKDLLQQYLNDPKNTAEAEHLGSMKALVSYHKEDDHWLVKCDFHGADGLTHHKVDGEDLFGWMWQKVKTLVTMPGAS